MNMEITRVQTGLRFTPSLIARLKGKAKEQKKSFNGYVEDELSKIADAGLPRLSREDYRPSDRILSLGKTIRPFTQEELSADPKLARLLSAE